MAEAVILSACRTPIGNFMGALAGLRAPELGSAVVREAVCRARVDPAEVEEVVPATVARRDPLHNNVAQIDPPAVRSVNARGYRGVA